MDTWPQISAINRFDDETDEQFVARATRIREILQFFRHRYYTPREGMDLERELERLESEPIHRRGRPERINRDTKEAERATSTVPTTAIHIA